MSLSILICLSLLILTTPPPYMSLPPTYMWLSFLLNFSSSGYLAAPCSRFSDSTMACSRNKSEDLVDLSFGCILKCWRFNSSFIRSLVYWGISSIESLTSVWPRSLSWFLRNLATMEVTFGAWVLYDLVLPSILFLDFIFCNNGLWVLFLWFSIKVNKLSVFWSFKAFLFY